MLSSVKICGVASIKNLLKFAPVVYKHTLPDLPYDYSDLEPTIAGEIMVIHHVKHHQAYINNLNVLEDQLEEAQAKGMFHS